MGNEKEGKKERMEEKGEEYEKGFVIWNKGTKNNKGFKTTALKN